MSQEEKETYEYKEEGAFGVPLLETRILETIRKSKRNEKKDICKLKQVWF